VSHDVFLPTTTHEGKIVQDAAWCSYFCEG
jgi:hypothetical protein